MKEWILSSAGLILAVLGIRWAVKDRISLGLRYGLWLLVLVRLLIPVNFFESPISIQTVLPQPQAEQALEWPVELPEPERETVEGTESPAVQPRASAEEVLTAIWLTGTAGMLAVMMASNLVFTRRLRRDRRRVWDCVSPVPVYVSGRVATPCLVGVFNPAVYVTAETEEGPAFDHVLAHELTHLRHFDHVFSVLRCLALALHWYNPLVWIAVKLSMEDGELACDEGALAWLGEEARMGYGETLIRLTCQNMKGGFSMFATTNMSGSKRALRNRIKSIAGTRKTALTAAVLAIVLSVFAAGCSFAEAAEPTEPQSLIQTETGVGADAEELEMISILPVWTYEEYPGETWTSEDVPEIVEVPMSAFAVEQKQAYMDRHDGEEVRITDVVKMIDIKPDSEESMEAYCITYKITTEEGDVIEKLFLKWYGDGSDDGVGGYSWSMGEMGSGADRFVFPDE